MLGVLAMDKMDMSDYDDDAPTWAAADATSYGDLHQH
jgi:hypothetical protein